MLAGGITDVVVSKRYHCLKLVPLTLRNQTVSGKVEVCGVLLLVSEVCVIRQLSRSNCVMVSLDELVGGITG